MSLSEIICFLTKAGGCFQRSLHPKCEHENVSRHLYFSLIVTTVVTKTLGFVPKRLYLQRQGLILPLNYRATETSTMRHQLFFLKKNQQNQHKTKH